jgi:hypothetical protein
MSSARVNRFDCHGWKGVLPAVLAYLALLGCSGTPQVPCYGLHLNHTYSITVEDRYDQMSKFTFTKEIASDPAGSCDPQLLIPDGTRLTMKVIKQMSDEGCAKSYAAVDGVPNVMFAGDFTYDYPYGLGAILAWNRASVAGCVGEMRLFVGAPRQQPESGDLFRRSQDGQVPEVIMQVGYIPNPGPGCTLSPCSEYYVVTVSP